MKPPVRTHALRVGTAGALLALVLSLFAVSAHGAGSRGPAKPRPAARPGQPDDRVAYPKIGSFRSGGTAAELARYDWIVADGSPREVAMLDRLKAANPALLGMIAPYGGVQYKDVFAHTYGYTKVSAAIRSRWGTLHPTAKEDNLLDPDGAVHQYGTVSVLNWQRRSTAIWSAQVFSKYYLDNATGHRGVMGVWGDNDFWSDNSYAWNGVNLDPRAWDDGFIAHHREIARLLPPGTIIGGNDLSSMADHPAQYRGTAAKGWQLLGAGQAGMKEGVNHYGGLSSPGGLDNLVRGIRRFLKLKTLDGRQRYELVNVWGVSPASATARLGLAASCISGAYFWGYTGDGGDFASTLAFSMPELTLHGRHWLGLATGEPVRIAPGLWRRSFQHGTVVANASGSAQTVAGVTVPDGDGAFWQR